MAERVGLFGGSFNPVHNGHLIVARAVAEYVGLTRVVLLPSARPPHKDSTRLLDGAHRYAMLQRAVDGDPLFAVNDVDLRRPGPCYTIDTVAILTEQLGGGIELCWLIGSDSLADLPTWHRAAELVDACRILTAVRRGWDDVSWKELEGAFGGGRTNRLRDGLVPSPMIDISSTEVRLRLASGRSVRYLIPDAVADYVQQHGLYGSAASPSKRQR